MTRPDGHYNHQFFSEHMLPLPFLNSMGLGKGDNGHYIFPSCSAAAFIHILILKYTYTYRIETKSPAQAQANSSAAALRPNFCFGTESQEYSRIFLAPEGIFVINPFSREPQRL